MSMLVYLLKVSLGLSLCWLLYRTTFRRLTFFQWNRFYPLASVVFSLILPLLKLQWGNNLVAVADFGGVGWTYVDHLGLWGKAIHPITRKETTHLGIDVAAPTGTPVYATADGVVLKAGDENGWGGLIVIEHENGYSSFCAHLNEIEIEGGAKVQKGEVIGRAGNTGQSTGPHLHYEVRLDGDHVNPADFF